MAKEQSFSLNSGKVSGVCGKLMCCLRYEHETYEEAIRKMPPISSLVSTQDGQGVVTEIKPLSEEIRVKLNDSEKDQPKLYPLSSIKVLKYGKRPAQKDDEIDRELSE